MQRRWIVAIALVVSMVIAAVVFKILRPAYLPFKPLEMPEQRSVQFEAREIPSADELKFLQGDFKSEISPFGRDRH